MSLVGFGYYVTVMATCKLLIRLTAIHVKLWAIVNLTYTVMYHPDLDRLGLLSRTLVHIFENLDMDLNEDLDLSYTSMATASKSG